MALTEKEKQHIAEEEAYRAKIREKSKGKTGGCSGFFIAVIVIVVILAVTLIAINPAKQFEDAEQEVIGKHAYNKTSGAYRGEILEVKPCNTAPELTCYVVNQPTFMRPVEAPIDNSVVKDEVPALVLVTPTLIPAIKVAKGNFMDYHYEIAKREDAEEYAAVFTPFLPSNDAILTGAMFTVMSEIYGKHNLTDLEPEFAPIDGVNHVRFKGTDGYYYFLPIKQDTGEIHTFKFWKE